MKTATVRQLRHTFGDVMRWVEDGERVTIRKRGKIIALLTPPPIVEPSPRQRVNLAARLKSRDQGQMIPAEMMKDILEFNKGLV